MEHAQLFIDLLRKRDCTHAYT